MIYTTQRRRFVYDTWDNGSRLDRVTVECILSITHCLRLNLQLHTIDLVRTCRISSFCTVLWQLARFQLTRRIARSLGDSWASCLLLHVEWPEMPPYKLFLTYYVRRFVWRHAVASCGLAFVLRSRLMFIYCWYLTCKSKIGCNLFKTMNSTILKISLVA